MKSKFLISLLLSLLIFILSGCSLLNKRKINELTEALMELNQHTKIDYNVNISLTAQLVGSDDSQVGGINSNFKIDMNEENPKAIVDVNGLVTYFTDGYEIYLGEYYNDKYFVREKDLLEEQSNTSIPEIKLNEIKYKFTVKEETRSKVYILTFKDDSLREIAEQYLGKTTIGYDMESKIKYYLDKETKSLKAYVMEFKFSNYSYKIYLTIEVLIREVGDGVEIEIPTWVYTKVDEYIKDHEPQLPPDEPEEFIPETTLNTVSRNKELSYHTLPSNEQICYDKLTNTVVISTTRSICIYDADDLTLLRVIKNANKVKTWYASGVMDVDNGKIVLTHGDNYFRIYDILDENYFQEITTNVKVKQILIDNNSILYANSWEDKANKVCLYNIQTRQTKEIISLGNAQLRSNKNDHIFYICDYKDSKYPISFVNAETGIIYHKALFNYKGYDFYYDGKFLHMADKTYDPVNGSLNTSYNTNGENLKSGEYEEYYQLVDSDKYGIIRDNKTNIYVYDNNKDTTIYEFKNDLSNAVKIGETRFLLYNYSTSSAIVIDVSLIK